MVYAHSVGLLALCD